MEMSESNKAETGMVHDVTKFREMVLEHPELPLVVLYHEPDTDIGYDWVVASEFWCELGEFLDCMNPIDEERTYTDRGEFEEDLRERMDEDNDDGNRTDEELDRLFQSVLAEYEPYWKKCILAWVSE